MSTVGSYNQTVLQLKVHNRLFRLLLPPTHPAFIVPVLAHLLYPLEQKRSKIKTRYKKRYY